MKFYVEALEKEEVMRVLEEEKERTWEAVIHLIFCIGVAATFFVCVTIQVCFGELSLMTTGEKLSFIAFSYLLTASLLYTVIKSAFIKIRLLKIIMDISKEEEAFIPYTGDVVVMETLEKGVQFYLESGDIHNLEGSIHSKDDIYVQDESGAYVFIHKGYERMKGLLF